MNRVPGGQITLQTPSDVVQAFFAALANPDRREALVMLTDDVEWWVSGPPQIPYSGAFRGREEVAQFFVAFDGAIEYEAMEVSPFIAAGDTVVVLGEERWRAKVSGHIVDNPWVMIFTVRDGEIASVRGYEDTAAILAAFPPVQVAG